MIERIYSVHCEQSNLLSAVADPRCTQADVASCYEDCLLADAAAKRDGLVERCDWRAINAAVAKRWPRGLERVKRLAWKSVGQNRR